MKRCDIDHDLLRRLAEHTADHPLLSVYLRTGPRPEESQKIRIRLKNARRDGLRQLVDAGMDERSASAAVKPLADADSVPWSHQGHGVAVFIDGQEAFYSYIPYAVRDIVVAADHFHLKPLFAALPFVAPYFVLALSQNEVSLFIGDGFALTRINLDDTIPNSLADATRHQLSERQLQHHSGDRRNGGTIFHGQGAGKDHSDAEIERFLRKTDSGIRAHYLNGSALILAGVSTLLDEFRRISDYPAIFDDEINGNVEDLTVAELHAKAWPIVERRFQKRRTDELEQIVKRATDRPVTSDLATIVIAAVDGRVARLFLAADRERWGKLDPEARQVIARAERQPSDNDLLDLAASSAYLAGAEVWPVPGSELPNDSDSIALLRY